MKRSKSVTVGLIGGVLVLLILALSSVWMGRNAKRETEEAVRSVSLLYLDELAGRREQVVAGNLERRTGDLQTALSLMSEEDLKDSAHLQAYQSRMKQLFHLEKFAFVDTHDRIYTSLGMQDNIGDYQFDPNTLTGPEISVLNIDSSDKKVIIAVPVESFSLQGEKLIACFMEIDMDEMLKGISLQAAEEGITFCNIYTKDGVALTNMVLGGLAEEDNLLDALRNASFDNGSSFEKVAEDFSSGSKREVSFTYGDIRETLAYVPVAYTDWLLTYLIRESVISERIGSISGRIVQQSLIYSLLIAAVLLGMSAFMLSQTRKNAMLTLEKEKTEAENLVRQQALEQRLQLQEQLLEQEKQRAERDNMITALSSDYRSVYYVNLDEDDAVCYLEDDRFPERPSVGQHFPFLHDFTEFGKTHVAEQYREGYFKFIDPENIRAELLEHSLITYRFLEIRGGEETYAMLRMAGVRHLEDRGDHRVHAVGVGFSDIDAEMRKSMEQQQVLSDALESAEQASRAKTAFLSSMSHEIRTPMNAIIGLDSLALRRPDLAADTREYLEKIGGSARHLLGLINDILDMSRIESGRMILRREEFSFREMLEQINTMVMSQCKEKGLQYECRMTGGVSDYYIGDDMKLKQVLINILSNAIKFTDPPGSVTLMVERTASFEDQTTLKFVIKDTGIGMDKSFIPKIFDSFTQEDSSRNNKYGSTGLGMAITKNIVTLMNGTISVESEKGVGSEFTVVITLKNCGPKEHSASFIRPKDMRVLVVDDEEIAAEHARIATAEPSA